MSTITAILDPAADGTLHLPVPLEWRESRLKVTAQIEPVAASTSSEVDESLKGFGALRGRISMSGDFDEPLADFREYME